MIDVKDYANVSIRVRYEAENKKCKIYVGDTYKLAVDLTRKADGSDADVSVLPSQKMRFNVKVQYGGIVIERVNNQNFKFNYGDYVLAYTENRDFFTENSTARVSYRNDGVLITNNDRNNIEYGEAFANEGYISQTGNMIFQFRYDSLNDFDPTVPLTVQKMVHFEIVDTNGHRMILMPFLYKNGNIYMLHCHIQVPGIGYVYENYYVNFELSASEAVSESLWLKYDSENLVVELGYPNHFTTIDLTKSFNGVNQLPAPDVSLYPTGEMYLSKIRVQFGGIYLQRYNNYSFVVEDPVNPDPIDPSITDYGIDNTTFDAHVSFQPVFDKGGYNEAVLTVFYKKSTDAEFTQLFEENGVYSVDFDGIGTYQFKYVISFDGVEISTVKSVVYSSTLFDDIPSLFTATSLTVKESEYGMKLDTGSNETNLLGRALGQFTVSGSSSVVFRLGNLFTFVSGSTMMKETWVDFSDGKNAVWIKILAFRSDTTNGNYYAYASIMTYRDGNMGTQQVVRENVQLNFNFDLSGDLNTDLWIEVKYEPEKNLVSVGKAGNELMSFDLSAVVAPSENYGINFGVTYGSIYVKEINGASFITPETGYEFPAPIINETAFDKVLIDGDKLILPENIAYDIFDRRVQSTVVLKDSQGNVVEFSTSENGMLATENLAIGNYKLTITARNARDIETVQEFDIIVIKKDLEPPVMEFASDAFSMYEKGDRDNKFITKIGTEITLPTPTLSDDSEQKVELQITVKSPDDVTNILTGTTFKAEKIGTYTVEYIATDVSGKETRTIFLFVVRIDKGETSDPVDTEPTKKGCQGTASVTIAAEAAMLVICAAVVAIKKKKYTK